GGRHPGRGEAAAADRQGGAGPRAAGLLRTQPPSAGRRRPGTVLAGHPEGADHRRERQQPPVAEDVLVDTPIALVQVSDRDQGENGVVTCTVVGDVPFQLKPASEGEGEPQNKRKYFLHTSAPLDYEAVRDYNVVIVAVDSGSPSLSSNNSLLVRVGDTNDNPPMFSQAVLEVSFPENNLPGERVATVVATDADSGKNAEITYSLEVTARDKGVPSLQGSTTVVVRVS
uniref:Protocadherin-7-like n=1 Tax=Cyanistes caeruleus TaxID=156563 RepID=A0A8C0U0N8_CYACU